VFKDKEIKQLVVDQTSKSKARAAEKRHRWLAERINVAIEKRDFAVYKEAILVVGYEEDSPEFLAAVAYWENLGLPT